MLLDEKLPRPPNRPPNFRDNGSFIGDEEELVDTPRLDITGEFASPARNRPPKPHLEPPLPLAFFLSASSLRATLPASGPTLFSAIKSRRVLTQVSDASRASFASTNSCLVSSRAVLSVWMSRCNLSLSARPGSDSRAGVRTNNPEMRREFVGGRFSWVDTSGSAVVCGLGDMSAVCPFGRSPKITFESDTEDTLLWLCTRPADVPVRGVKDIRLDEGWPANDNVFARDKSTDRSAPRLIRRLSDCNRMTPRLCTYNDDENVA